MSARRVVVEFLGQDKSLGKTMSDVDGKSSRLMGTLGKVGKVAAIGLAAGAAAGAVGLYKLTQGAMEDEAAQQRLATTLKNTTGATDRQVAGVESWISAQGKALGVADDDLRPALQRLAEATGDVGAAQELTSLAMDVSAGTGKSLKTVSEALMKAQNGQISGLSRLGIETTNAAGETLTFEQATKKMSETFGGQAAAQAGTLEGKMDRLKLILSEAGETIGSKLIPVVTQLADWFLNKVVPAVSAVVSAFQSGGLGAAIDLIQGKISGALPAIQAKLMEWGRAFVAWIGPMIPPALAALGGFLAQFTTWVYTVAYPAIASALVRWGKAFVEWIGPMIPPALNALGSGLGRLFDWLVGTGLPRLLSSLRRWGDALVEWIAPMIPPALAEIGKLGLRLVGWVLSDGIPKLAGALLKLGLELFQWIAPMIPKALAEIGKLGAQLVGWVVSEGIPTLAAKMLQMGTKALNSLKDGAVDGFQTFLSWAGSLPGKIVAGIGDLGGVLLSAGRSLIQGLIDGVGEKVDDLRTKLSSITNMIPDWKGPLDKDKILLTPAGEALIEGLIKGIDKKKVKLQTVLEKITDDLAKKQDKLASLLDRRQAIVDSFKGMASSVFGANLGGDDGPASIDKLLAFSANQRGRAEQLNADIASLVNRGMSPKMLEELAASGQQGMDNIRLMADATDEQIRQLVADNAATQAALEAAGLKAAEAVVGEQIKQAERDVKLADDIRDKLAALLEKQDKNTIIQIKLGGRTLHASLLQLKRESGQKLNLD